MAKTTARSVKSRTNTVRQTGNTSWFNIDSDSAFQSWMLIPLMLNPILMINSVEGMGFAGMLLWTILATVAIFFTVRAPWTLIATNPLYIVNGVHTIDFYIKAIYIGIVYALTFFFVKNNRDKKEGITFTLPDLFWLAYMVWGFVALFWSIYWKVGFERLLYLNYGIAAYIIGKQTEFWRSATFWRVYVTTALVIGTIGIISFLFGGDTKELQAMTKSISSLSWRQILSFDWIMSAGRPSSTLAYRAYAGTYLATALPFLLWYMFSRFVQTPGQFIYAAASFIATFTMLVQIRARSGWMGAVAAFVGMAVIFTAQKRWVTIRFRQFAIGSAVVAVIMIMLPASGFLLEGDTNPQRLKGTGKEDVVSAVSTIKNVVAFGRSDRFDFWTMSKNMLFGTNTFGKYAGPANTPAWMFGIGIGQFPMHVPMYSTILHNLGAEIHNDWIQSFVELGVIGFITFNGFMLMMLYYAIRGSQKGILLACVGGILAWLFATQTDFLTPRIYGAVWVGAMVAIITVEGGIPSLFTLRNISWHPALRIVAGIFFVWMTFAWAVTMWVDRQIYGTLTSNAGPNRGVPANVLPDLIFSKDIPDRPETAQYGIAKFLTSVTGTSMLNLGIGKYLIFSPILDFSKLINDQAMKVGQEQPAQRVIYDSIIVKTSRILLELHPTNYNTYGVLSDIYYRNRSLDTTLMYADMYVHYRPDEWNGWLYKAEISLNRGDSASAARFVYKAMQANGDVPQPQTFWYLRLTEKWRSAAVNEMAKPTAAQ